MTVAHKGHADFFLFPRFSSQVSTTVNAFLPRCKGFHRGAKVSTAVETFTPRWKKCFGENVSIAGKRFTLGGKPFLCSGNVFPAV